MTERRTLARYTVPPDQIVGKVWQAWDGGVYRCIHSHRIKGFWMQLIGEAIRTPAGVTVSTSRYVPASVFGWSWHPSNSQQQQEQAA